MRRDAEGLAFGAVTAVAVMLAAVGLALLPLLTAPVVRAVADHRNLESRSRLSRDRALEAVEMVRVYVTTPSPRRLPLSFYGRDAFDARTADHLDDVRGVILGGVGATLAACLVLGGTAWLARRRGRVSDMASGMRAGGIAVLAVMGLSALLAVVSFEEAFTVFHSLFFADGTWTFEYDDLIILLFPERFWATMGAAWAVLAGGLAAAALAAGTRLRAAAGSEAAGIVTGDV